MSAGPPQPPYRHEGETAFHRRCRAALWCLLLVPLLWWVIGWTRFRNEVEIVSTGSEIVFSFNGQSVRVALALPELREINVRSQNSIYPHGGERIRLEPLSPAGGSVWEAELPESFQSSAEAVPVGDWYVEYGFQDRLVFSRSVNVRGPFRLRATFLGRGFGFTRLGLRGEPGNRRVEVQASFRCGMMNNDISLVQDDRVLIAQSLAADPARHARHLLGLVARALLAGCVLVFTFSLVALAPSGRRRAPLSGAAAFRESRGGETRRLFGPVALAVVAAGSLGLAIWTATRVLERMPHFQDDFSLLVRAQWLLAGHLDCPAPPVELRPHFDMPFLFFVNDRWLSQYPIGWPLLLALGVAAGAPWLVSPICGALAVVFTGLLGRILGGWWVGLMAAVCLALSPMHNLLAGSMLGHAVTGALLALCVLLLWRGAPTWRLGALFGAGLALGYTFGIRPLTALAVAPPLGLWLLGEAAWQRFPRQCWLALAALVAGGCAGAAPALVDNWLVTGSPARFAYAICSGERWSLGLALPGSLLWADATAALVGPQAFSWGWPRLIGWPWLALGFGFATVPFLTGRATRRDVLLLGLIVAVPLAYLGTPNYGLHGFGPRYYADVFFALFLLVARGFQELGRLGAEQRWTRTIAARPWSWPGVAAGATFLLLSISAAATLPTRLRLYWEYNAVDRKVSDAIAALPVPRALILLEGDEVIPWIRASPHLRADLNADLVFARLREDNTALLKTFLDRPVFVVHENAVVPYPVDAPPSDL